MTAKPNRQNRPRKPLRHATDSGEQLLSPREIAAALHIPRTDFYRMVAARKYPSADLYIGRLPRWRPATHSAWIESNPSFITH